MGRRLRELCSVLDIPDELRLRIWTCFEYSLIHCTHLMRDRHLDQLLMCAIYIMAKVGLDRSERALSILLAVIYVQCRLKVFAFILRSI